MTTHQITLILGGVRSGKSTHAQQLAMTYARVCFIATATAGDAEMHQRIQTHQAARPSHWTTLEVPLNIPQSLGSSQEYDAILLDCLTMLTANILMQYPDGTAYPVVESRLDEEVDSLMKTIQTSSADWIIVSNEVGMGVVPPYELGRYYRDLLGRANQKIASIANHVLFMVAGIPMVIK
jgi:adenosylcobinamide kinase / adenosylcobinamide-phosphate guanylyltransferase